MINIFYIHRYQKVLSIIIFFVIVDTMILLCYTNNPEYSVIGKLKVAIVSPTFTTAAYNRAFYMFYNMHDLTSNGKLTSSNSISTDLQLLTGKIPEHNASAYGYEILRIVGHVKQLLPTVDVTILNDSDIDEGKIFKENNNSNSGNVYNMLILGHQEYVTKNEYYNLKDFISKGGGTIIFADANFFYAEVNYNKATQTVTLVKGHGWQFNGKNASRDVFERWSNETSQWVGSNFYYWGGNNYDLKFKNNPFNYTHFEEQYITNPDAKIILNYEALAPNNIETGYPIPLIAAYEMNYKLGKVVVLSIFSDNLVKKNGFFSDNNIFHKNFIRFFDALLLENVFKDKK